MYKKWIVVLSVTVIFLLAPFHAIAKETSLPKDEVVYAVLHEDGHYEQLYVVNKFQLNNDGTFTDHGAYESVKNLTNLEEINVEDGLVTFTGDEGVFHYEGLLHDVALPWEFQVTYYLDGEKVEPTQLAGKNGHVKMTLTSKRDKAGEEIFFNHYILQIGANFPMEKTDDLKAKKGMIANAGDEYQVTFTVMPEEEAELIVEADVTDFQFGGFEINAVPSFIDIEEPDVDEMAGDMNTLQKAIREINNGVLQLRNGLSEFRGGANELYDGSASYKEGIDILANEVSGATAQLDEAFSQVDEAFKNFDGMSKEEVDTIMSMLENVPQGLEEIQKELQAIKDDFIKANDTLNDAVEKLPNDTLTKEQIEAVKNSDLDDGTINVLLQSYEATKQIKEAYDEVEAYNDQVVELFDTLLTQINAIMDTAADLDDVMGNLTDVSDVITDFSSITKQYEKFRDGIAEMTNGISTLATTYGDIHAGIGELASGSKELENGAATLYDGTSELKNGTDQLPDKLKEEIDALMEKYDKSNFDMVSFVSNKNEKVEMVQFVMKTEPIETKEEPVEEKEEDEKTMWQRFLDLFSWLKFW